MKPVLWIHIVETPAGGQHIRCWTADRKRMEHFRDVEGIEMTALYTRAAGVDALVKALEAARPHVNSISLGYMASRNYEKSLEWSGIVDQMDAALASYREGKS